MKERDVEKALLADQDMKIILEIIASLELRDVWLCAGTIRNFLWNGGAFDPETDVDVIFHDVTVSYEETLAIEKNLRQTFPNYQWEVKNQVYMHQHNPETKPYLSSKDAMSKYPERCTAIGARLLEDGRVEIFCPYGLEDIFYYRVRPTPYFQEHPKRMQLYRNRLVKKNWKSKWPQLNTIELEEKGI
ncbi:TPA: nucleotidyltransferase family protein [Streptococcus suis]